MNSFPVMRAVVPVVLTFVLAGCGGGGGGSSDGGGGGPPPPGVDGRALKGPLGGAVVNLYAATDFTTVLQTTTTLDGTFDQVGRFTLDPQGLDPTAFYVVEVKGGMDHDANDDGVEDVAPTPVAGSLHALLKGAEIIAGNFTVNVLTEVAYESLYLALGSGESDADLVSRRDAFARRLLKTDLSGDGTINGRDLAHFDPATDQASLVRPYTAFQPAIAAIVAGKRPIAEAQALTSSLLATLDTPGDAFAVAISGTHAYVADATSVQVIDIGDPGQPVIAGKLNVPDDAGKIEGIAVSGTIAYIVDGPNGLLVADVGNAAHPSITGSVDTPGFASAVAVSGTVAYVADQDAGVQIVDVSDPAAPRIVATVPTEHPALDLAVFGTTVYVAGSLQVIDASDPAHPVVDTMTDAFGSSGIAVSGSAGVASGDDVLKTYDLGTPTAPVHSGRLGLGCSGHVAIAAEKVVVACPGGVKVVDVSDPAAPVLADAIAVPDIPNGAAVTGELAYVADEHAGILVAALDGSGAPPPLGMTKSNDAVGVAVSGTTAVTTGSAFGLELFDVSGHHPTSLAQILPADRGFDAALSGATAFLATQAGLEIVDTSDAASPRRIGGFDTPGTAAGIALSSTVAFVADTTSLQAIDVSSPAAPSGIGSIGTSGSPLDVAVSGTVAYVADGGDGLQLVDVTHPAAPALLGRIATGGSALQVAVSGTMAFVAVDTVGLVVVDASDPAHPALVATVPIAGGARAVALSGTFAFAADAESGVTFIDVSNPASPQALGVAATLGAVTGIAATADRVYTVTGSELQLFSVPMMAP